MRLAKMTTMTTMQIRVLSRAAFNLLITIVLAFMLCECNKPAEIIEEEVVQDKTKDKGNTKDKDDTNGPPRISGQLTNLGPQVYKQTINGSTFAKDKNGNDWLYTVTSGTPARLIGFQVAVDRMNISPLVNIVLSGSTVSWTAVQATDGWVYIGTSDGRVFRHFPGSRLAESLGLALKGENFIWELTPGKNGEVFGATYPGAKVFRYHPDTGFQEVSNGAVKEGENYARSIVYHEETDMLYVGVGAHTGLIKLNPRTGSKTEILPPSDRGHAGFVYYLRVIKGEASGDKLLATITDSSENNKTLIYDINTGTYTHQIGVVVAKTAIKSPVDNKIYVTTGSRLYSFDLASTTPKLVTLNENNTSALAITWLTDNDLCYITGECKLVFYNKSLGNNVFALPLQVPPSPITINSMTYGPDGRVWMGGFFVGNNASYDPATGKSDIYQGLSQSESISCLGKDLYFGIYPGAKFYRYDTTRPWVKDSNPKWLGSIAGQDRPYAYAAITDQKKMFFGTVPGYGRLGGALVEYNTRTNSLTGVEDVVKDQSIVSLCYADGVLYGGTSVWGGLGVQPIANEAKLFEVNPKTRTKMSECVPVPGAKAITALLDGPDSHLWGMADGTLFIFDKTNKTVLSTHELFKISDATKSKHAARNACLILHPSGRIFGRAYGELFELNPVTKTKTAIGNASASLTMDDKGHYLYFSRDIDLWRYTP
ncbi:MAG: hypothetical protein QM305_03720 [Bacteroidota bacterium]|nr:hypothetical protein [Bacteroidota bacterium]